MQTMNVRMTSETETASEVEGLLPKSEASHTVDSMRSIVQEVRPYLFVTGRRILHRNIC